MNEQVNVIEEGRTISVSDLPARLRARLEAVVASPETAKVAVIAICDPVTQEWEAYAGYPDKSELKPKEVAATQYFQPDWEWLCEFVNDIDAIKIMGDILTEEEARELFPANGWPERKYKEAK